MSEQYVDQVVETILQQLGGANRLTAMLGVRFFVKGKKEGNPFLKFQIVGRKTNTVIITYNVSSDYYDIEFWNIHNTRCSKINEVKDVDCEALISSVESGLGLALHL